MMNNQAAQREAEESLLKVSGTNSDAVLRLLDAGADIEMRDDKGTRPLMRAAVAGEAASVRLLLQRGADAKAVDDDGFTAHGRLLFFLDARNWPLTGTDNLDRLYEVERLLLRADEIRADYLRHSRQAADAAAALEKAQARAGRFARLRGKAAAFRPLR